MPPLNKSLYLILGLLTSYLSFLSIPALAQDKGLAQLFADSTLIPERQPVINTFKSPVIVNAQSNETLHKHDLVFNISHRFDDIAGNNGGVKTFFGLDNSTDIKIFFEYGISDKLTVGIGRAKGAPEFRYINVPFNSISQLWEGKIKYRLLQQTTDNHIPVAVTLFANAVVSSRSSDPSPSSDAHFQNFSDRWGFTGQVIFARKFSERLSIALLPTYIRRNYTAFMDENNFYALGLGGRWQFNPHMAIIVDYFIPFRSQDSKDYFAENGIKFYAPLSVGWEIETGGHVFHIDFTNATAILENQFIPYTTRKWGKGEFRWGFNISRTFTLFSKKGRSWSPK